MIDIIKETPASTGTTTTKGKPDVVILLDASGSMAGHRDSVVSTFNEYVEKVRADAHSISLYTFDSNGIREKILHENPSRIRKLTHDDYLPGAMTPLFDAMGKVMQKFDGSERNVQFVTHTDGLENDSKEWNLNKLKEYIETLTNKGWLFVYLGEGVDGFGQMSNFQGVKFAFSSQNRDSTMCGLAASTSLYAATASNVASSYTDNADGVIDVDKGDTVKKWKQGAGL